MPNVFQGDSGPVSGRFAIVVSRYNEHITGKLLAGMYHGAPLGSEQRQGRQFGDTHLMFVQPDMAFSVFHNLVVYFGV